MVLVTLMHVSLLPFRKPEQRYAGSRHSVRWVVSTGRTMRRWLIALSIVALVVLAGFIPYPYETGGPFTLMPIERTDIAAQVEGRIERVLVREGEWVEAGQPLAQIDRRTFESTLAASREQRLAAEAQLRLAEAGARPELVRQKEIEVERAEQQVREAEQLAHQAKVQYEFSQTLAKRNTELFDEHIVSQQQYDAARHEREVRELDLSVANQQVEVAQKQVEVARAELEVTRSNARPEQLDELRAEMRRLESLVAYNEKQLALTEIDSPRAGRVVTPRVDQKVGQYLEPGDVLASVEQSQTVRAEVKVPQGAVGDVKIDARVKVVLWAYPDTTFIGKVVAVAPVATEDLESSTVRVQTELANPDGLLKSDMTGYAKIASDVRPLWRVMLWKIIRWFRVEFWYWLP
jgi:putative peptide zinc metalloprotease protein